MINLCLVKRKVCYWLMVCMLGCCPGAQVLAQTQVILFKQLWNGTDKMLANAVVIVEDGLITEISTDPADIPNDAKVIDLSNYSAIPGMIDAHTHMTYFWDKNSGLSPWQYLSVVPSPTLLLQARVNARKTLEAGITTVRDLSSKEYLDIQMRDLIAHGVMTGPRILAAGYGLHTTLVAPKPGFSQPNAGRADGVDAVMRVSREQIAAGADWVKLFGSSGSGEDLSGAPTFTADEIQAATDIAHQRGKRVAFHSYGLVAARKAVKAGVDSIEHAVGLDKAIFKEMVRRKIIYVPTIDHNRYYIENKELFGYSADTVQSLLAFIQSNLDTVRMAHKHGVRIAMGSDAVFTMFGQNTRELAWFVKAGMSPTEALTTATLNGAMLLGMDDRIGQLKPGYYADIVAVEGDPIKDINTVIQGVRWVMKGGKVVVDRTKVDGQ